MINLKEEMFSLNHFISIYSQTVEFQKSVMGKFWPFNLMKQSFAQ